MLSIIKSLLTPKTSARDTRQLECFFCGEQSNIPQTAVENVLFEPPNRPTSQDFCTRWTCPSCESVNVRDQNGEVVDYIPEMRDPLLNRVIGAVKPKRTAQEPNHSVFVFCEICELHQRLVAGMLAEYLPDENEPEYEKYSASIDTYRRDIESRYPLVCANCQIKVDEELSKQEKRLLLAGLDRALRQSQLSGSRSKMEGVKPIVEPVPWWKQFGWAIWGIIWVTAWVATIIIHIQGIFISPSYCDITEPLSTTFTVTESNGAADHFSLDVIIVLLAEIFYTTKHTATACLAVSNTSTTCTCALRNAFLPVLFFSLLSAWFNPTWRSRALGGSCKPVDGWNTYKKSHLHAVVARLCIYLAIAPTTSDSFAKLIHVALLTINLMCLYDSLKALKVLDFGQLGTIRPDGLRVAGKRTSLAGDLSPNAASQRFQMPIWTEPPDKPGTQRNMHAAHSHPPSDTAAGLASLSIYSRNPSPPSRRQGGIIRAPSSSTFKGPQNISRNPFLSYKLPNMASPVGSFGFERRISHQPPVPNFGSISSLQSQHSPFETSMARETFRDHDSYDLRPQRFSPPQEPTGLEDLLNSFNIDDRGTLKRLRAFDDSLGGQPKFARRLVGAATLLRFATLLQDMLQYFYIGFMAYSLFVLIKYTLTSGPRLVQGARRATRVLIFLLCIRLTIIIYTTIITYMTWQSVLMTANFDDDPSWNEASMWYLDMLQFPFLKLSEVDIYLPLLGDLSSMAGFALDMGICWYGEFVWKEAIWQRPHAASIRSR